MDKVPDATVSMSALYAQTLLGIVRFGHPGPLVQGLVQDCCAIYPICCMRYQTQFELQAGASTPTPVLINGSWTFAFPNWSGAGDIRTCFLRDRNATAYKLTCQLLRHRLETHGWLGSLPSCRFGRFGYKT